MPASLSEYPSPYVSLPETMSEQDWRNTVNLLLLRVKVREARLTEVEQQYRYVSERVPVGEQASATLL